MHYLGNTEILKEYKVGFLCSRKVPSDIILKTYDWAIEQRDSGICVVSGFHSKIEKDVFHYLLKGTQPIILVLARSMLKKLDESLQLEIGKGRLLVISPFSPNVIRASQKTCNHRNAVIIDLVNELFVGHITKAGELEKLLLTKNINYTRI